jgi:lysophospholipase
MFYSSESKLKSNQSAINSFYDNTLIKSYLSTPCGQLFYAYAKPSNAHTAIVISSGRIEGLDKYKELLWELYNNNFAVFIVDHQGQGRSYRHLKNKHKGYVKCFKNYSLDFDLFNTKIVDTYWQGKKVLVSHSMGGAIAFDYLAHFEHSYSGAFLSAPMLDIYTKGTPKPLAKLVASSANLLGFQYSYALGQTDYSPIDFALNVLTSSQIRYDLFRQTYQKDSMLQLGGVTYGWLHTAFSFISSIDRLAVNIPLYIASAQNDEVVDNSAQYTLAKRHKNTVIESFAGAKHELFFERDEIRQPLLTSLYTFCESVTA